MGALCSQVIPRHCDCLREYELCAFVRRVCAWSVSLMAVTQDYPIGRVVAVYMYRDEQPG